MSHGLYIQDTISIPEHELTLETSKAGGPGGQYVNKTESRVLLRWNIPTTSALTQEQKDHVLRYFQNRLTHDGDLIIIAATERSQHQNKELAYKRLQEEMRRALYVPKERIATKIPKIIKEKNIQHKKKRALIKKFRSKIISEE